MDYLDLRQHNNTSYVEVIKDGEIIRVPEAVAIIEDLFVLRKVTNTSVPSPVAHPTVQSPVKMRENVRNSSIMYDWKHGKFGGKKNNAVNDLLPNFNWEVSRNRKLKNMTRAKLGQMINATEEDVKMIELGQLPADDFVFISRIEQVFGINLRKHPASIAQVNLADLQRRNEQKKKQEDSLKMSKDSKTITGNDIEILE